MPWKPTNPDQKREQRVGSYYRGYDNRWRKFRKVYLMRNPLCVKCGKTAEVVDHIIPWDGNKETLIQEDNLQALCKHCHNTKTGTHDSRPVYGYSWRK